MKKATSLLLALAMTGTLLAGCGSTASSSAAADSTASGATSEEAAATGEQVTIKLANWDTSTQPAVTQLVEAFEAANPDIKVEIIDVPSADYTTKLSVMLNGGSDVDAFYIKDADTMIGLAQKGQLADLTPYIEADGIDLADFNGLAENFNVDGKQYAMPARTDYYIMYYNKDVFDAAGVAYPSNDWTWADFEEIAGQQEPIVVAQGLSQIGYGFLTDGGCRYRRSDHIGDRPHVGIEEFAQNSPLLHGICRGRSSRPIAGLRRCNRLYGLRVSGLRSNGTYGRLPKSGGIHIRTCHGTICCRGVLHHPGRGLPFTGSSRIRNVCHSGLCRISFCFCRFFKIPGDGRTFGFQRNFAYGTGHGSISVQSHDDTMSGTLYRHRIDIEQAQRTILSGMALRFSCCSRPIAVARSFRRFRLPAYQTLRPGGSDLRRRRLFIRHVFRHIRQLRLLFRPIGPVRLIRQRHLHPFNGLLHRMLHFVRIRLISSCMRAPRLRPGRNIPGEFRRPGLFGNGFSEVPLRMRLLRNGFCHCRSGRTDRRLQYSGNIRSRLSCRNPLVVRTGEIGLRNRIRRFSRDDGRAGVGYNRNGRFSLRPAGGIVRQGLQTDHHVEIDRFGMVVLPILRRRLGSDTTVESETHGLIEFPQLFKQEIPFDLRYFM